MIGLVVGPGKVVGFVVGAGVAMVGPCVGAVVISGGLQSPPSNPHSSVL
jgi:hypothetical protein